MMRCLRNLPPLLFGVLLLPAAAFSQSFECSLTPTRGFDGVMPRAMALQFDPDRKQVVIRDDVLQKLGQSRHIGVLKRAVGDDLLFKWRIEGVPNALKPSVDRASLGRKVTYQGRLDTKTGALRVSGSFSTIRSGTSAGQNMRADGRCRRAG